MLDQIVLTYCICDEVVKIFNIRDDIQCKMTSAEVITFAIMSARFYGCNYKLCRLVSRTQQYFRHILSHSQLVRRVLDIPHDVWNMVFFALKILLRQGSKNDCFVIDSFPVKAYENHKSFRAKIFSEKIYHGYTASKKQYFFGIKVHMIVDTDGIPIEFTLTPGSVSDIKALQENFSLDLPQNSVLLGDAAYTCYSLEDMLLNSAKINLIVKRKSNHRRQNLPEEEALLSFFRNGIETVFSSITSRMPRYIKARTEKGFCLKIFLFIIAYMMHLFCPLT